MIKLWSIVRRGARAVWHARMYVVTGPVRLYRLLVAPLLPNNRCRYMPTCSVYMTDAVQHHGVFKGAAAGTWRVLRCHPWGGCGCDPAEDFTWPWERAKRKAVKDIRAQREAAIDQLAQQLRHTQHEQSRQHAMSE